MCKIVVRYFVNRAPAVYLMICVRCGPSARSVLLLLLFMISGLYKPTSSTDVCFFGWTLIFCSGSSVSSVGIIVHCMSSNNNLTYTVPRCRERCCNCIIDE